MSDAARPYAAAVAALRAAGCVAPGEEALLLDDHARGGGEPLSALVRRRAGGEPLAWLIGWAPFMGLRIAVDPGVYVPRPHTELLVRRAAALCAQTAVAVDLCTGSGAIAAALGRVRPGLRVLATDVDPRAVDCARRNGVDALEGDMDAPLAAPLAGRIDLVTANPPYVPTAQLALLARDVREREPVRALDGGTDGLDGVRRVAEAAVRLLRPGGALVLEIGAGQGDAALAALAEAGLAAARLHLDAWRDGRVAEARRPPTPPGSRMP